LKRKAEIKERERHDMTSFARTRSTLEEKGVERCVLRRENVFVHIAAVAAVGVCFLYQTLRSKRKGKVAGGRSAKEKREGPELRGQPLVDHHRTYTNPG
jgi:hypothetical protein